MSLLNHIQTEKSNSVASKCKTCATLKRLTPEDRDDFIEAVSSGIFASLLSRAINTRLGELDIDDTLSESSVKAHIRNGHVV